MRDFRIEKLQEQAVELRAERDNLSKEILLIH